MKKILQKYDFIFNFENFILERKFIFKFFRFNTVGEDDNTVGEDKKYNEMFDYVLRFWKLERPKQAIIIVGDVEDETDWTKAFVEALVETARLHHAWIVTNGKNRGITKLIGLNK